MVVVCIIQCENEILVPERIFNNHQTLGVGGEKTPRLERQYSQFEIS